jgi:hypothetical protein
LLPDERADPIKQFSNALYRNLPALHDKAKGSPNFRFYAPYDKVYREDVMTFAYECCKANGGAAGVDDARHHDEAEADGE